MAELCSNISEQQKDYSDALLHNQAKLTSFLLNMSDHLAVMPKMAYKPRVKQDKPEVRGIRIWPHEANSAARLFWDHSVGHFRETAASDDGTNFQEYNTFVVDYINKCIDDVVKTRNAAFKSADAMAYSLAGRKPVTGIREANRLHVQERTAHFMYDKDPCCLWQGFQYWLQSPSNDNMSKQLLSSRWADQLLGTVWGQHLWTCYKGLCREDEGYLYRHLQHITCAH